MKIYVGNLPYSATEEQLRTMFSQHGEVTTTSIIIDRETGRSKGFGFVEIPNDSEGEQAIQALNEVAMDGRNIKVNQARPREERPRSNNGGGYRGGNDRGDRNSRY